MCPLCGDEHDLGPLLAAADAYVVKVLEGAGKRIVRDPRSRFTVWAGLGLPLCRAYMQWPMGSDAEVAPLLRGAWSALGELSLPWECFGVEPGEVAPVLDRYVTDLLLTGSAHTLDELAYRLGVDH